MPSFTSRRRLPVATLFAAAALLATGCAHEAAPAEEQATSEVHVELAPAVVVVTAGATGTMRGRADVFGLSALDQSLAEWKAEPLHGEVP